jgi:hypothetical protein
MTTREQDVAALAEVDAQIDKLEKQRNRITERMQARRDRAYAKVLTVAELLDKLREVNPSLPITDELGVPLGAEQRPDRGRPLDLAIDLWPKGREYITVAELIDSLEWHLANPDMESYKGYSHTTKPETKVWAAEMHDPGRGVVGVRWYRSKAHLVTKEVR